jgi:hypothetical protein
LAGISLLEMSTLIPVLIRDFDFELRVVSRRMGGGRETDGCEFKELTGQKLSGEIKDFLSCQCVI